MTDERMEKIKMIIARAAGYKGEEPVDLVINWIEKNSAPTPSVRPNILKTTGKIFMWVGVGVLIGRGYFVLAATSSIAVAGFML